MSTELHDALARASEVATAEFVTRDAAEVITPASRRVSRHRAALRLGAGLASVAVLGGMLWAGKAVADARIAPVTPAAPSVDSVDVPMDPNPDVTVPNTAWTTLDLAVRAYARAKGDEQASATAGMICRPAQPADNTRVRIDGCRATWFPNGPSTALTHWSVSASKLDHSLTYSFSIQNSSAKPLAIDTSSVFMWIETKPEETSDTMASYPSTLVSGSMWTSNRDVSALVQPDEAPTVIGAGGTYSSAITATTGTAASDPLATLLANAMPYRVSLWARVHEPSPHGDSTYLIQLGSYNDASWSLSGQGKVP